MELLTLNTSWTGSGTPARLKIIRGRVEMTKHDTGETVTPAMVHIFTMSPNEPGKVRQTYGEVGPEKL